MAALGVTEPTTWQGVVWHRCLPALARTVCGDNIIHGAMYWLPIYIVTFVVGGFWEVLFAMKRGHEVNEGFFVSSILFALILPPTFLYGR